jgi:calcium-independent phospholipase A2-gamma
MRGVVALEVLRQLEAGTGKRIHELFDMICGVSTGSIIAAFLAFHKKPVDNVEEIYRHLGQKIFTRNVLRGTTGWLTTHSYYDSEIYETILKSFVGETAMSDTVRAAHTPKVAIVSTLVSEEQICPYVFRNYHYPYRSQSFYRGSARHPIWAAVRASSAAPGYFDEFALAGKIHHDGGMMCNNATLIAVHEAQRLWPNDSLQCVVSLGMGRHQNPIPPQDVGAGEETPKALSLAKKFARVVDAATDTEIPHVALHDLLPGSVYYRFNPVLSEYFPLDVANLDKMAKMREDTQMYLRRNRHRVREACDQLSLERRPWDTARDYANIGAEIALAKVTNRDLLS